MSDDILNRIDETLARHRQRFDPLGGDVWDEDRVDRWGDGMRVRPASAGFEEESEPDEAAAFELIGHNAPEPASFNPHTGQVTWTQNSTSPWVSFADVAAGPVAGADSAVDLRRRVQDGTAPAPDPVADAMRAEVLRQGLTECEIDGVLHEYVDGGWRILDETHVWRQRMADVDPVAFRRHYLNERVEALRRERRPFLMAAIDDELPRLEAEAVARLELLSLECGMGNPLCSGCDGLARSVNRPCMHECHAVPVSFAVDISADGSGAIAIVDSNGRFHVETVSPLVDAALEPTHRCHLCDLPLLGPDIPCMPCTSVPPLWSPPVRLPWWKRWTR